MATTVKWWDDVPLVEARSEGEVRGPDLARATRETISDPRFPSMRWKLCDLTSVDHLRIAPADILTLVGIHDAAENRENELRRLAVAAEADFVYGHARMFETLLGDRAPSWEIETFRSRAGALGWLGLSTVEA